MIRFSLIEIYCTIECVTVEGTVIDSVKSGHHHLIVVSGVEQNALYVAQPEALLIDEPRLDCTLRRVLHQQMAMRDKSFPSLFTIC